MEPGHEKELVADADPLERVREGRLQVDRRVRRSFAALARRIRSIAERGTHDPDRDEPNGVGHPLLSWATRIWLPDGSRNPASTP
jgi:hypothetical protein